MPIPTNTGSYNPYTNVYTSPSGEQSSRPPSNVPSGTYWDYSGGGSGGSGGGGGGSGGGGSSGGGQSRIEDATRINNQPVVTITTVKPAPTQEQLRAVTSIGTKVPGEELKYAASIGGQVYTSEGYRYPGAKEGYVPVGYTKGEAIAVGKDSEGNVRYVVGAKGSSAVTTKYGTAIISPDKQYNIIQPNEKALATEQKAYADWASTQQSREKPSPYVTIRNLAREYKAKGYREPRGFGKVVASVGSGSKTVSEYPETYGSGFERISTQAFYRDLPSLAKVKIGGRERSVFFPQQTTVGQAYGKAMGGGFTALTAYSPAGALPFAAYGVSEASKLYLSTTAEQRKQAVIGLGFTSLFLLPQVLKKGVKVKALTGEGKVTEKKVGKEIFYDAKGTAYRELDLGGGVKLKEYFYPEVKPVYTYIEERKPVVVQGADYVASKFKVTRTTPEQYALEESRSKVKRLFFEPAQKITPGRVDTAKVPQVFVSGAGDIVRSPLPRSLFDTALESEAKTIPLVKTQRQGANIYTVSRLSGRQIPIDQSMFARTPSLVKEQLKRAFPVSYETGQYTTGEIISTKLFKSSTKKGVEPVPIKPGQTRTVGSVVTETLSVFETPESVVSKGRLNVIDISKPGKITGDWESIAGKPKQYTYSEARALLKGDTRESRYFEYTAEKAAGFYMIKKVPGFNVLKKDTIFIKDNLSKEKKLMVIKHETGHYLDYNLGIVKNMTPEEQEALFKEATDRLTKRYASSYGGIPSSYVPREKRLAEGVAMRFEDRPPIQPLKEVYPSSTEITITGVTTTYKEPLVLGDEAVEILSRGGKQSTSTILTSDKPTQTIQLSIAATAQQMPKVVPRVPTAPKPSKLIQDVKSAVTYSTSQFSGKGQYETMQVGTYAPMTKVQVYEPSLQTRTTGQVQIIKPVESTEQKDFIISRAGQDTFQGVVQQTKTAQAEEQISRQQQKQAQMQKSAVMQKLAQNFGTGGGFTKPKTPIKPPKFPKTSFGAVSDRVKQAYDVIIYTRGKEQVIAKGLPEYKAKKLGTSQVLTSLRASFKLRPRGTTLEEDITYKLPETFRLGKYDKLRFVQKKTTRFGTRSETKEAQFFRKVVKYKIKWL